YNNWTTGLTTGILDFRGHKLHLAWQWSSAGLVGNPALSDESLQQILHVDALGLCYSSAIHVSTMRAGNLLMQSKIDPITSATVRGFLEELSMLITRAEMLLGWVEDDEKLLLNEYSTVNDFERRYQRLMDLERG